MTSWPAGHQAEATQKRYAKFLSLSGSSSAKSETVRQFIIECKLHYQKLNSFIK
jgi:hypothetical protein